MIKSFPSLPTIYLLFRDGRLGNQIMQYYSASNCEKKHLLILFGFDDLLHILPDVPRAHIFTSSVFNLPLKAIDRIKHRFRYQKSFPLPFISLVTERDVYHPLFLVKPFQTSNSKSLIQIYHNIFGLHDAFHQKRHLFQATPSTTLAAKVASWLYQHNIAQRDTGFLHIRLGDYRYLEKDGVAYTMPDHYYTQATDLLSTDRKLSNIVILSDEPDCIARFKTNPNINYFIGPKDPILAWALMNHLYAGVLSASTFSLSAALFGIDHKLDPLYICPPTWPGAGLLDMSTPRTCYFKQLSVFNKTL